MRFCYIFFFESDSMYFFYRFSAKFILEFLCRTKISSSQYVCIGLRRIGLWGLVNVRQHNFFQGGIFVCQQLFLKFFLHYASLFEIELETLVWATRDSIIHSGPENLKKSRQKNLWNQIYSLVKLHFWQFWTFF